MLRKFAISWRNLKDILSETNYRGYFGTSIVFVVARFRSVKRNIVLTPQYFVLDIEISFSMGDISLLVSE